MFKVHHLLSAACAISALGAGGCAMTAPAPGGRLRSGAFTQFQPTWAVAYSPSDASVARQGMGTTKLTGNGDVLTGDKDLALIGAPIPISLGLRQTLGRHVDVGAHLGWAASGMEVRMGPADDDQRVPWVLSLGARTGKISSVPVDGTYDARIRFEAYPGATAAERGAIRLSLWGGLAGGVFSRVFLVPDVEPSGDVILSRPTVDILRPELRVETGIGIYGRSRYVGYLVAVAPWFLVANGAASSTDRNYTVQALSSSSGVALTFSLSLGSDHEPSNSPSAFKR